MLAQVNVGDTSTLPERIKRLFMGLFYLVFVFEDVHGFCTEVFKNFLWVFWVNVFENVLGFVS